MVNRFIHACLKNKVIVFAAVVFLIFLGIQTAPFDWKLGGMPRSPVPVDAIPDIGENQQIVFTEWMGRSPRDVEDQITYPLTVSLLGIANVKTVRSYSMFGFSTIYVIFKENVDFYWSRSRILEKLASLPEGSLPMGVQPSLGPDATALGQVFWYTLEGRDEMGNPAGGWDLQELRSIQDFYVKYNLMSVEGISEVASVGGFVKEYQIDVNPHALFAHGVTLPDVFKAVRHSNRDVGARTIEVNSVEYVIRGLGFIESVTDLEETVVKVKDNIPIKIKVVASVGLGPALRRGALDKEGAEAVGGVAVVRYGENPLKAINRLHEKIVEISDGLPEKNLNDGRTSKITIVPFYDRTELIHETLNTLKNALTDEILITIIVVLLMVMNMRMALMISGLLPLAVLSAFIAMKQFGVDANVVALSGIAIAIGTIVDMGIILSENILKHLDGRKKADSLFQTVYEAAAEVSGAILTAISTTVISFLPVFSLEGAEGKLFKPLAFTKTFALIASVVISLSVLPPLAHWLLSRRKPANYLKNIVYIAIAVVSLFLVFRGNFAVGILLLTISLISLFPVALPPFIQHRKQIIVNGIIILIMTLILADHWVPLGSIQGFLINFLFTALVISLILGGMMVILKYYSRILHYCLTHIKVVIITPLIIVFTGLTIWLGFDKMSSFMPEWILRSKPMVALNHTFPGLGKEFMPFFDEGSFLYMPTTMPHASIGEAMDVLQTLDKAIKSIPEVNNVVGKIGRAESPLDPAPVSMVESIITIIPEYQEIDGEKVRQWRSEIQNMDDIWDEIVKAAQIPGTTSAPKLMPIATRIVMLQSGMRAPMGIKVKGPNLEMIESFSMELEQHLKKVPGIKPATVFADRIIGKPYLEIEINREEIARYGLHIKQVQDVIEIGIGGKRLTSTVEGRERYPVRVRYARELRDDFEDLENILIPTPAGQQIPLIQLADIRYVRGPQMIKSEDTLLIGYVIFDKEEGYAEVDVVENAQEYLQNLTLSGKFDIPAGINYRFTGSYENQIRAAKRLSIIFPAVLAIILLILYLQFNESRIVVLIFAGIFIAWSGGFILIWLYNQSWFLNFFGLRELFHIGNTNLSVAVWVGFLALFGIATDDGVLMATYLKQRFKAVQPKSKEEVMEAVIFAGQRRARPALMTIATTLLALIPVLTSTGKGADIMVPMAIPVFGGMVFVITSIFIVPALFGWVELKKLQQ